MDLSDRHAIFIGFKLDGSLRRHLDGLTGPDKRYVSREDSTFLSICMHGDDHYVGKVVDEPLTTGRVDDVCRNVLSILRRLCPEQRLPNEMDIRVCRAADPDEGSGEGPDRALSHLPSGDR